MSGRAYLSSHLDRMLYVHGDHAEGSTLRAIAEARAILAETEPTHPERWTLYDLRGRREGLNSALTSERLALAESLRSFVEA